MRTKPDPNPTTIKYRSTPEYKDGNRENQRARETAVPFRLIWPDKQDFRKLGIGEKPLSEKPTYQGLAESNSRTDLLSLAMANSTGQLQ
jgi:hypothetical protein